jgi:hypothetical protein
MSVPVRVMIERGRKKPVAVAVAFDWPGWERSSRGEDGALAVLADYRRRYARVVELAGLTSEFGAAAGVDVVERVEGLGMTDYYGVSMRSAAPEREPMSEAECERKLALLQASWTYFDDVASRVPAVRKGPRGGGRDRDAIVQHAYGAEAVEFVKKVGVVSPPETWQDPDPERLRTHRDAVCAAIRDHNARGASARSWTLQFLIRRCAYHMLDHAWELEDKDLAAQP